MILEVAKKFSVCDLNSLLSSLHISSVAPPNNLNLEAILPKITFFVWEYKDNRLICIKISVKRRSIRIVLGSRIELKMPVELAMES